jgi:hypothetical protein
MLGLRLNSLKVFQLDTGEHHEHWCRRFWKIENWRGAIVDVEYAGRGTRFEWAKLG